MSDNPRPVLYGSGYEAFLARDGRAPRPFVATVVGKHCESGDVIVRDAAPAGVDLAVGDVLATPVTGAYGHSMASNYNKVPRPPVVFVATGRTRVVVRRETYEDLVAQDVDGPFERRAALTGRPLTPGTLSGMETRALRVGSARVRQRRRGARPPHRRRRRADRHQDRAAPRAGRGRRAQPRPGSARWSVPEELLTTDAAHRGRRPRHRRGRRGHRWHRAGPHAHPRQRSRRASRSSPPTRSCWPTAARSCSRRPPPPASTCSSRRPSAGAIPLIRPLRESLAGERIRRVMGIVNGTTNFILSRMTETRRPPTTTPWPRPRASATPSATRPPTSRATTPRPRPPSWPTWPSAPGWSPATSTARASAPSPRPTSPSPGGSATSSSCWPSSSTTTVPNRADRGAGPPGDGAGRPTRWPRCGTRSTPCSSRATPSAS